MKKNKTILLMSVFIFITRISFAIQPFDDVEIGMNKVQTMKIIGVQPKNKKKFNTGIGILECWEWDIRSSNTNLTSQAVVFADGEVFQTGLSYCPGFF